jgi:nitronate monooxygenase
MLRTPVCDLLGIEVPIMQAAIWPATAPKLVEAVSEAGSLGRSWRGWWPKWNSR